ncbi:Transcriptional regulator, MarR family protein [Minicystis rosea]|nr:Transcriptional regulator, MarR family protein [Minicystis rosea]
MQDGTARDRWSPATSASFWINRASRALLRVQEARLRPLGLGMGYLPVLHALQERKAMSQKDLAARAEVEQPTMAAILSRMERDGVVQREPDPNDRRASLVTLTRLAYARFPKAKEQLIEAEEIATAGFTEKEKELLRTLLERVVKNLDK